MFPEKQKKPSLEERVLRAAAEALADHHSISPIDVLTGIRFLEPVHVERWRKGMIPELESVLQGSAQKHARVFEILQGFAAAKGLRATEATYLRITRDGPRDLQFTLTGDPEFEKFLRTHYVSPDLTGKQKKKVAEKANKAEQPAVFQILRDSACSECGVELPRGSFLWMEGGQPLCLACVGRDDLEYLPAGDAALTRRATKYSGRSNVVVRFSRSRGRYERQGILVEKEALERAERECTEDAQERAAERAKAAVRRVAEDRKFVTEMTREIQALYPGAPAAEARAIAEHTAVRGSGRVGRSAEGRMLGEKALALAVAAAIRHNHTEYDRLLAAGTDRATARGRVGDRVRELLEEWGRPEA